MNGLVGFVLMAAGVIAAASPYTAWYLSIGWKFKDAEPSDAALAVHRFAGVVAALAGLVLLVSSCASMFSHSGDRWKSEFVQRLEAGEAASVSMGRGLQTKRLTDDEMNEFIDDLREAELTRFEPESSFGFSSSGVIEFADGEKVEIIIKGSVDPFISIELHPDRSRYAYRAESSDLRLWIQNHVMAGEF